MRKSILLTIAVALSVGISGCSTASVPSTSGNVEVKQSSDSDENEITYTDYERDNSLINDKEMIDSAIFTTDFRMPKDWQEVECDLGIMKTVRAFMTPQGGVLLASDENVLSSNSDFESVISSYIDQIENDGVWGQRPVTVNRYKIQKIQFGKAFGFIVDYSSSSYKGSALFAFVGRNNCTALITMMPYSEYDEYKASIFDMFESVSFTGNVKEPYIEPAEGATNDGFIPTIKSLVLMPANFENDSENTSSEEDANENISSNPSTSVPEGTYLVGKDISAGTYRLTAQAGTSGYWEVKNEVTPDAKIVGNENFDNSTYVTVSDGQYLTLNRCSGELQQ